jgi:hypothetical protein
VKREFVMMILLLARLVKSEEVIVSEKDLILPVLMKLIGSFKTGVGFWVLDLKLWL